MNTFEESVLPSLESSLPQDEKEVQEPEQEADKDKAPEKAASDKDKDTAPPADKPPEKATEAPKPDPLTELQKRAEAAEKAAELAEKRRRDTERAWQEEHQRLLDLERAEQERVNRPRRPSKPSTDDDKWFEGEPTGETTEQPPDAAADRLAEIERKIDSVARELREREALGKWAQAEAEVAKANPDYQSLVYGVFEPAVQKDADLKAEFAKDPTPAHAYELAKKYHDRIEAAKDPDAYRRRLEKEIREKVLAELGGQKPKPPQDEKTTESETEDVPTDDDWDTGKPAKGTKAPATEPGKKATLDDLPPVSPPDFRGASGNPLDEVLTAIRKRER